MLPDQIAGRWRDRHATILQQRARQTGCWVLSADVVGHRDRHHSYGCSIAIDPTGAITHRVSENRAGIVLAEISPR